MDKLWYFFNIALDVFPFIFLQYLPFRDKLKLGYTKTIIICSGVMLVQFLGFVWLAGQPFCTMDSMLLYRIGSLATLLVMTVIFVRDHFARVYFVFGLMTPYVMATIAMGSYFSFLLRPVGSPMYMYTSMFRFFVITVSFPFIYILAKKYLLTAMKIGDEKMWRYALPVPVVFSLVCLFFVDAYYEMNGVPTKALFGMLFVFFGCIFTCYFLLKALHQVQEKTEYAEREKQSRTLLAMQQDQYKLIAQTIESTRAARHDLRHQLTLIGSMAAEGDNAGVSAFISKYKKSISPERDLIVCENYAANSIIAYYIALAETSGVLNLDIKCNLENECSVEDTDLCVLLGNLFENAIEGSKTVPEARLRKIKLRMESQGGYLFLTVDNTFDGVVQKSGERYLSRKRNGKREGVGLASVSAVVEKYGGSMRIEQEDGQFCVSVSLEL